MPTTSVRRRIEELTGVLKHWRERCLYVEVSHQGNPLTPRGLIDPGGLNAESIATFTQWTDQQIPLFIARLEELEPIMRGKEPLEPPTGLDRVLGGLARTPQGREIVRVCLCPAVGGTSLKLWEVNRKYRKPCGQGVLRTPLVSRLPTDRPTDQPPPPPPPTNHNARPFQRVGGPTSRRPTLRCVTHRRSYGEVVPWRGRMHGRR